MSEKRLISSSVLFTAIEEELQNHHQASFTITGMSMWPFLCHGRDKVIITACAAADLKKRRYRIIADSSGKLSAASCNRQKDRDVRNDRRWQLLSGWMVS